MFSSLLGCMWTLSPHLATVGGHPGTRAQVLPNRPRTRQVYLGTEREAVKASVKAKTRFNRKKTSTRERLVNLNASGAVPRTQNAFGHNCESRRSGYGGGGYATRRVAAAGELEGDGLEHGSLDSGSCSSVFDPVANFR